MRLAVPANLRLADPAGHPLHFTGSRGERFQISVLEDDLIRVQHLPEGKPRLERTWLVVGKDGDAPPAGRLRDDLSPFSLPAFSLETTRGQVSISTQKLRLDVALTDAQLSWFDSQGNHFAADLLGRAYTYDRAGKAVYHYLERRPDEHYFGFGERSGPLDKVGRRMRMLNLDALGYDAQKNDPLYKHFPFYITWLPELQIAYGLFYDNLATCVFDMGQEIDAYYGPYRYYQADEGDIDCYFIYGPSIEQVVEKFSALTGRMTLPPRWSLGYLGSTMSYTEAEDAQDQLKKFVDLCAEHSIPCDGFHLSSGYSTGKDGRRNVFTWNRDRVPAPAKMSAHFHGAGMHLAANIKPCLFTNHPRYEEVKALGGFILAAETDEPEISMFWDGKGSYVDFTNPVAYDWWKAGVKEALLAYGIDATWNDNNEYEIWDDQARCNGFGHPVTISAIRPLFSMLMTRASYEAQREYRPDERPFLLCRSGCPGIQRYAQTWSGDNSTSWSSLRYNIPMGLGLGLSGAPNTGHDVGGFYGSPPDPELFVRWVQNGIFHPRFTIHSWHFDGTANEPWMYPEALPTIRAAIEFRYRLIPYLYSLFVEAAAVGHPIVRPMVYAFPQDPHCTVESFDFMLGPNLLVASVLEAGARQRAVYLPQGTDWCDFYTGEWFSGGKITQAEAPLERIPLFVPAGGIVPMGKVMRHLKEQPDDLRQAYVFPHPLSGRGRFTLTEDDGITFGYQRGESAQVGLEVIAQRHTVSLHVQTSGRFPLPYRNIEFILPSSETRAIDATGDIWADALGRKHVAVACPA